LEQVEEEDKELIVFHLLQLLQIVLLQVELLMEAVEAVEQPEQDLEHNQDKLADQVSLRLPNTFNNLCQ
jgi:hypothetical protein